MFDRIVCINLDNMPQRWGAFMAKIDGFGWEVDRVRAIHGDTTTTPAFFAAGGPAWGCRQSHLRVLEDAMLDNIETLCVFEDDATFCPNFIARLTAFMKSVPCDWEVLMIGGQRMQKMPEPVEPGVLRSIATSRTHAFVIRGLDAMREIYRIWAASEWHIDHKNYIWQQRLACYEPIEMLCGQDEGYSSIAGQRYDRRYWSELTADVGKIYLLDCSREVAEACIPLGVHYGFTRSGKTGRDAGMVRLDADGFRREEVVKWASLICGEARDRNLVPAIWDTSFKAKFLSGTAINLVTVTGSTPEDIVSQIPELSKSRLAATVVWLLQTEDRLLLDGLAYHGFHRGHHVDSVTGLDQGLRTAMSPPNARKIQRVVNELRRDIRKLCRARVLLAHPQITLDLVPDGSLMLTGSTLGEVLDSFDREMELFSSKPNRAGIIADYDLNPVAANT